MSIMFEGLSSGGTTKPQAKLLGVLTFYRVLKREYVALGAVAVTMRIRPKKSLC